MERYVWLDEGLAGSGQTKHLRDRVETVVLAYDSGLVRGRERSAMSKFLVLYRSSVPALEQMADATPEQAQEGMQAWQAWGQKAGSAVVDFGAPLAGEGDITGFSIMEADSRGELEELLADHPHRHAPGAAIDVLEFLALPGM